MIEVGRAYLVNKHSYKFIDEFKGFVGFGLSRESNENTVIYYLQKFADDKLMELLCKRFSDNELEKIFNMISALLKKHLNESEYHDLFLK